MERTIKIIPFILKGFCNLPTNKTVSQVLSHLDFGGWSQVGHVLHNLMLAIWAAVMQIAPAASTKWPLLWGKDWLYIMRTALTANKYTGNNF